MFMGPYVTNCEFFAHFLIDDHTIIILVFVYYHKVGVVAHSMCTEVL